MKTNLQFDFLVNKDNATISVQREFNAQLPLVWKAWTTAELLDQWWGPEPWRAETKTMDFKENGFWHYAMVSPEGEKHWCKAHYLTIVKEQRFSAKDGFCDEAGVMNTTFPQNHWDNTFIAKKETTVVSILLTFETLEDLETIISMGFKEGFTMGLNQLDKLLPTLK